MNKTPLAVLVVAGLLAVASVAQAQSRPYIGFVYPAGAQQGTTCLIKLGGQGMDDVDAVFVSGAGVSARLIEYHRRLGPLELSLLSQQLRELKKQATAGGADSMLASDTMMMSENSLMESAATASGTTTAVKKDPLHILMAKLEKRIKDYCNRPACASIASLAYVQVTMTSEAAPGLREIRIATPRGVSNPLPFYVGQLPETVRTPMVTADFQVLGKEELAQRKRPDEEEEVRIGIPCTMNGQIASGEANRYRFEARRGQRLVISAKARQLVPYIADAVPGWFQAVLSLRGPDGREVAYNDDYRFKPDPTIFYEVPKDGEYVLAITDAIYRGREDFVYRISIGELPLVTSIFPLGGRVGAPTTIELNGWNLEGAKLTPPPANAEPDVYPVAARIGRFESNHVPFALDALPECFDQEPNNNPSQAQKVKLPVIINGHIDRPDDWDVFRVDGRAGETLVAEVHARQLDSPLDSLLKITDASGKVLAFNDDYEIRGSGLNTHDADSYLMFQLPADGAYYVQLGDTARGGGKEYAYRLRISAPRPDFALRVVPSSLSIRGNGSGALTVYVIRKDGFKGPIKLGLKDPPQGFSSVPASLSGVQPVTRIVVKTDLKETEQPVSLVIEGRAKTADGEIAHRAVPAEDRMQAFLWRHLVPAQELLVSVFDPSYRPPPKRVRRDFPPGPDQVVGIPTKKPRFTKQQVAWRLRQITALFEEGLLTDEFDHRKLLECETGQ